MEPLSVLLVDFMKPPSDLSPADDQSTLPSDSSDTPTVVALRDLSVCLVDCMKTPGLKTQSHASIEVELKEEDEQPEDFENLSQINMKQDQQPDRCDVDFCKEEVQGVSECDDKDPNCEVSKTEERNELRPTHTGADGTLSVVQNNGGGTCGAKWLIQDYRLSEPLKTTLSNSAERQEEADSTDAKSQHDPSDNVSTQEQQKAEDTPEPGAEHRRHHCVHCGKYFARKSNVVRHQRHHCSMTESSQPESERTQQTTYSCNKCSLTFWAKRHLRLHVRVHTENNEIHEGEETSEEAPRERRHACSQCNKSFYLLNTLRQHILTHTGEKSFSCEVCGKQFGREGTLKEHQLIHTGEKPFKCEQCGKTCARRGDLKIHMLSHSEERPYSCSCCAKSFKQLTKLRQHERVHTGERPYQCKFCPKRFRIQISLAAHQYTHSGEKPFKCTLCPKAFSVKNNLKKHQMIHTGEKPYSCSHCGKSCRLLQHLIVHKRSHTGEKPYKWDKCGKAYSQPSALKTHQTTHEEKPPRCSLCGQDFTDLTSHECGQTAEKPYRCLHCGKCFSQTVNLKKHQLIHTGEKPCECKDCGKQFNHKSNLTKHIRIHTGEKPFECEHSTTTRNRGNHFNHLELPEANVIDPRGARPVEHGTRADKCATQKEWPFCTDDEWNHKCPSGCRIQGLMDKYDHSALKRIEKIRSLLDQNRAKHRSTDQVSKQTYDYLKEKLTVDAAGDTNYYDLAQNLRQRITDMKIKIDRQLRILAALKDRVKDQVIEMQKLEVDIDIKLRSCKGSCAVYTEYQVDKDSYVALEKQINQLDTQSAQTIETVGTLYVMKSKPLKDVVVDSIYKSGARVEAQQTEDMFPEVNTVQLILEQEGSSTSPATISKVPGTSFSPATSSSSSASSSASSSVSSSHTSSKSITELGGHGNSDFFGIGGRGDTQSQPSTSHVSTKSVTCTKSVRRTVVHTPEGPVEKVEEVMSGGPECQAVADRQGGMNAFFPSITHTSSSSSSSSSSFSHTGSAKGSILGDTKTGFGDPFGFDLGAFKTHNTEDDLPDFHARSVKTAHVERQADYIGKDCVEAYQNHLKGETNGLFKIRPGGTDSTEVVEVYCHQEGLMGGWLLVQQRESGALSFNRTWVEYRNGFGSVDATGKGEVWLGNKNLHLLTNQGETMLNVELEDWEGGKATAQYTIRVGSEEEGYPLHVSGYNGDAGDALVNPKSDMALYLSHNGMKFSTFDKDNDKWEENCAEMYGVCMKLKQQNQDGRQPSSHVQTYRKQHCRANSNAPLCSDDDWVFKCPTGCRLQGLILQMESEVERKLKKVCKTAKTYEDAAENSMAATTHIYNYNRRVIVGRYMSELKFVDHAEGLAWKLTLLRNQSSRLSQKLDELQRNVQKQIEELYRTEVDIDMKLRACHGSCRLVLPFGVDHSSYQALHTDMEQMEKTLHQRMKAATPPDDIPHIKLQPVDVGPAPSAEYKTIPTVQKELLTQFEDIGQNQVVLEELLEESADVEALDLAELE
ncbi:hypothetical protein L3Q82_003758 [Scortum barcoo]|uniref:Uncharacterized protein n=1 Tax=Scortum barcoo TaxID=214431 RepID=A0ACB8X7M1_9TELE|nr:hypothetical protein L3Q82_003758 [Scortum barcoo]